MPSSSGPGLNKIRELFGQPASRSKSPEVFIHEVTPALASKIKPYVRNIRHVKAPVVANYAIDMGEKKFTLSNDALAFDVLGWGVNGEHRYDACIASNESFQAIILLGVESDAVLNMDRGAKRDLADYLKTTLGVKHPTQVASATRLAVQLVETKIVTQSTLGLTNERVLTWFLDGHETIVDDVERVRALWSGWPKSFTVTHAAAILHASRFVKGVKYEDVLAFLQAMAHAGAVVEHRSPPVVLHKTFETARNSTPSGRVQQPVAVAMVIKALNMYLAGGEAPVDAAGVPKAGAFLWRVGKNPEAFPVITAP